MKSTKKKPMPEFRAEAEERTFWSENDSTQFIEWRTAARQKFPQLKPTLRTISSRLPRFDDRGSQDPGGTDKGTAE
ncbi:MAG: CopG family antitoxin [Acidobacteria bacterium]|nr:CopG family antitoxin [Acidobacteriota bacterium]